MAPKVFAAVVLLLIVGYGFIKAAPLIAGPSLSIDTPTSYTSYPDGFVGVEGVARHSEAVFLNGGPLYIDPEGRFSTTLLLPTGGAILSVTATDRFGRSTTERRIVHIP